MTRRLKSANSPPEGETAYSRPPLRLSLSLSATTGHRYLPYLRKHLPAAHALLRAPLREFSVALVGDVRMSRLHERFLGIRGPTDVLTFELEHDARGRVTAGEAVICVPQAQRAARAHRSRVGRELLLYALHGMLHLTGYDDITEDDYRKMHQKEDDILRRLGVGATFNLNDAAEVNQRPENLNRRQRRNGAR